MVVELKEGDKVIATFEDPFETLWKKVKNECENIIKGYEDAIIVQKELLNVANKKLSKIDNYKNSDK